MLFVTFALYILLIPIAILAGKGCIAKKSTSRLRSVFTVVQAAVVLAVTVGMFEVFNYDFSSAGYATGFFRVNETVLISFYILTVMATEAFSRSVKKNGALMPYLILSFSAVILLIVYAAVVEAVAGGYFQQLLYAVIGLGVICLMHITNMLLDFNIRWQRTIITVINVLCLLVMSAAIYFVLKSASEAYKSVEDAVFEVKQLAIVVATVAILAVPSLTCSLTILSEHLKLNNSDD